MSDPTVVQILEDTKAKLKIAMPEMHFFFMLMPIAPDQMALLGHDALVQVEKRLVKHLQQEIHAASMDQRRET